jgi:hypothetical protein
MASEWSDWISAPVNTIFAGGCKRGFASSGGRYRMTTTRSYAADRHVSWKSSNCACAQNRLVVVGLLFIAGVVPQRRYSGLLASLKGNHVLSVYCRDAETA